MTYPEIKELTRKLKNNPTPLEQILWRYLRKKQLDGRKFLRQHAIIYESVGKEHFFYVPDFYCEKEKLAIELDGKIHIQKEGIENVMKHPYNEVHKNGMNITWMFHKAN
jgi:very-short-patch-repair endonuclease